MENNLTTVQNDEQQEKTNSSHDPNLIFCKHCGGKIPHDAVICTLCGRQVSKMNDNSQPQIIINNENSNSNVNTNTVGAAGVGNPKNKWVAFFLALFLGGIGAHKFYEGKILLGIVYLVFVWTGIPSFIAFIDAIIILFKSNPYYV